MHRNKHGFTLLELIIVVIIIGILASIALPRYIKIAEKGRVSEAKSLLGAIKSAQLRYSAQYGEFDSSADFAALDLTLQTPKYFTFDPAVVGADVTDENTIVAGMVRTPQDNPGCGAYELQITQRGEITFAIDPTCVTTPAELL